MSESTTYDNLIVGNQKPPVVLPGRVRVYESFSRGQIVGRLTATGKWQVCDASAYASFNKFGVALEAVDTTDGNEVLTDILVEGEVATSALLYSYDDALSDWSALLEAQGLYPRDTVTTSGT